MTQEQFQKKIAARLKQTEQLYRATAQAAEASDEDLKTCYNLIRDQLTPPDLRKTRHIFLATLNKEETAVLTAIMKKADGTVTSAVDGHVRISFDINDIWDN